MTRKEERNKASIDYADKFMAEVNKINDEQWKWAQKHPDEPTVAGGVKACWIFQRSTFLAGAEWADKTMLKKACKWLEENAGSYLLYPFCEYDKGALLEDFRKAMKEE